MTFLEGGAYAGHTANDSRKLLAQCVDQAVVSVAAGTAKLVALTVDDDVEHLAFIPNSRLIRFSCNSSIYALDSDLHIVR